MKNNNRLFLVNFIPHRAKLFKMFKWVGSFFDKEFVMFNVKFLCVAVSATLLAGCHIDLRENKTAMPIVSITGNTQSSPHLVSYDALKADVAGELHEYAIGEGYTLNSVDDYRITAKGKTYNDNINLKDFGAGFQTVDVTEQATATIDGATFNVVRENKAYLYQQEHSIVARFVHKKATITGKGVTQVIDYDNNDYVTHVGGTPTKTLPADITATYKGKAFSEVDGQRVDGDLVYNVNFGAKTGSGTITSGFGNISLNTGSIQPLSYTSQLDRSQLSGHGITGTATSAQLGNGEYELGFFGDNAEEIAGAVDVAGHDVSFAGKR